MIVFEGETRVAPLEMADLRARPYSRSKSFRLNASARSVTDNRQRFHPFRTNLIAYT